MTAQDGPEIAVVGGGPAGLIAAETLASAGRAVTVFDRMPSVGRKFQLAGRGGLNLTHGAPLDRFLTRYRNEPAPLMAAVRAFPPEALRAWGEGLGQETFVGTSGRVFPRAMKTAPLLRAWLVRLAELGVTFAPRHAWSGWGEDGALRFTTPDGTHSVRARATVMALGGASWPRLGSDGAWVAPFADAGVAVAPLAPANVGFVANWSPVMRERFAGAPLKRIALGFDGAVVRGEAMITDAGLEGGAVYALSGALRDAIAAQGAATVTVDLMPDAPAEEIARRLAAAGGKQSLANRLRKALNLAPAAIGLINEAAVVQGEKLASLMADELAQRIKAVPVTLSGVQPIARAISTAGGVAWDAIDSRFMLAAKPGVFVAGEMLDWEAPTGGYLLQGCFATGVAAARGALAWLEEQ